MKDITSRQQQVLDFFAEFIKENGFPPTVREVGEHFQISLRAVQDHIAALQKKGYLSKSQRRARSISVVTGEGNEINLNSMTIPVLGNIAKSDDLLSEANIDSRISLSEPLVRSGKTYFAIRVRGMGMKDAGILDGDLAVVEQGSVALDGQIVVAMTEGSLTVRRFYKESDGFRLQPENSEFKAIFSKDVKVEGILTSVIRQY